MSRHGENIRKRKDGRWEKRIMVGHKPDGRPIYWSIYDKSYRSLVAKAQRYNEKPIKRSHIVSCEDITLEIAMQEWIESRKAKISITTYLHYYDMMNQHIFRHLGNVPLSRLTDQMISDYLEKELINGRLDGKGGLSPKTVNDIKAILKSFLKYANKNNWGCKVSDITYTVSIPTGNNNVLTEDEEKRLFQVLENEESDIRIAVVLALYCGLRIGEICALKWQDIDFQKREIHVNKTMIRLHNSSPDYEWKTSVMIKDPKSKSSIRNIPIHPVPFELLTKYKSDDSYYILSGSKKKEEPKVCRDKYKKILEKAKIEDKTFHALRHTFATRGSEYEMNINALSAMMGHSSTEITLNRYVHPSMEFKHKEINKIPDYTRKHSIKGQ